jgi:hypothetical protein
MLISSLTSIRALQQVASAFKSCVKYKALWHAGLPCPDGCRTHHSSLPFAWTGAIIAGFDPGMLLH